jgi:hypothetical protein
MPGRVWRDTAPAVALAVLALGLVAVSFAPWYGLSFPGLSRLAPRNNVWNVSGHWMLAVVLGTGAAPVALANRGRPRRWLLVMSLALLGLALVLLPAHIPLCHCGRRQADFGWFAYAPLDTTIGFGPLWGRWVAAALLLVQVFIAALQLWRARPRRAAAE